jgi:hypothetical protein
MAPHQRTSSRAMSPCQGWLSALLSAVILTGTAISTEAEASPAPAGHEHLSLALPGPTPPVAPQGVVMAATAAGLPAGAVSVPISLVLEPGIMVATLDLTLSVAPLNGAPTLTRAVSFAPAAALAAPDVLSLVANNTVEVGWRTALTPPFAGTVQLGVLQVRLPTTAPGQEYDVLVTDPSATGAGGAGLTLVGVSGHVARCSLLVSGQVTDAASRRPVAGADICFGGGSECVQSDTNGFYGDLCFARESSAATYVCARAPQYAQSCQGPWIPGGYGVSVTFALVPTGSATATPTPTPTPPESACVGDCDGSGEVTVDEVITMVNITLGNTQPSDCPNGIPVDADVDITLIVRAVNNALGVCPSEGVSQRTGAPGKTHRLAVGGCPLPSPLIVLSKWVTLAPPEFTAHALDRIADVG